jgi:hypothetical protein
MRKLVVFATFFSLLLMGYPAGARSAAHLDPNDTRSRLDMKIVRLSEVGSPHTGIVRVHTYDTFNLRRAGTVEVYVDSRGDERWDRQIHVYFDPASPGVYCPMYNYKGEGLGYCTSVRVDETSVEMTFPWSVLKRSKQLRWRVETRNLEGAIVDLAPNAGWYPR